MPVEVLPGAHLKVYQQAQQDQDDGKAKDALLVHEGKLAVNGARPRLKLISPKVNERQSGVNVAPSRLG
jgi:hypothetical protein